MLTTVVLVLGALNGQNNLLFALFGWWLDGRFGTGPVLAIAFGLFGMVGQAIRIYYQYRARMEREEEGKPWTQSRQ